MVMEGWGLIEPSNTNETLVITDTNKTLVITESKWTNGTYLSVSLVWSAELVKWVEGGIDMDALVQRLKVNFDLVIVQDIVCITSISPLPHGVNCSKLTLSFLICHHLHRTTHPTETQHRILVSPGSPSSSTSLHRFKCEFSDLCTYISDFEKPLLVWSGHSIFDLPSDRRQWRQQMLEERRLGEGSWRHALDIFKRLMAWWNSTFSSSTSETYPQRTPVFAFLDHFANSVYNVKDPETWLHRIDCFVQVCCCLLRLQ